MVEMVLAGRNAVSGTALVPAAELELEDPSLAGRARIAVLDTPKARPSGVGRLESGMALCAAACVRGPDGRPAGALHACVLLNGNNDLVDQVQSTVFRGERYRGKLIGTATIFQDDVRISTNVQMEDGSRAIGTRVSAEVYDHVLGAGKRWVGPAWVVSDWYVSAYEPVCDLDGRRIGMLYIGVLRQKFSDLTWRTVGLFALVASAGLAAAALVAWKLADGIARPVASLASASAAIARGDFAQEIPVSSPDEIGSLTRSFNSMARALRERDELLKDEMRQQLTRSERLAAVGRLAAGVAHEINNPLTGVLTFAHLLLRDAPEGSKEREDIETIIDSASRCRKIVRGLLDFSRQSEPRRSPADLNGVLREALSLTRNQARISRVNVVEETAPDLPEAVVDADQIQQVAVNLMLNAVDAMPDGGDLTVRTRAVEGRDGTWVEFEVADTGVGIPPGNLERVFDPFFTTKPAGKGTGLGLAIAYGIVAEHGGRIAITSEVGRGTTARVRLPATPEGQRDGY
jgi:two-component system NtrC family sensor kinase